MERTESHDDVSHALALGQGVYFVATGLWPIVHLRSFEAVTGPKREGWLVKTVGALLTVVGSVVFLSGLRRRVSPEIRLLGSGAAAAMGAVDIIYSAKRRISPIYLVDAVPELLLAGAWWWSGRKVRQDSISKRRSESHAAQLGMMLGRGEIARA